MPLPEPSEEVLRRLIQRYLKGETQVCQKLLERRQFYEIVEKLAKKYFLATSYDWEDATQIAFEKVLQAAREGKFRQGNADYFYRWSTTVAHNCIKDLVRKKNREYQHFRAKSLNQTLSLDTDTTLDELTGTSINLWDSLETTDSLEQIELAIQRINEQYPPKNYLKIWQGLIADKKQIEIAQELNVKQAEISKRKQELACLVWKELGWFSIKQIDEKLKNIRQGKSRSRSQQEW